MAWDSREQFQTEFEPLSKTISQAKELSNTGKKGPVLLIDTADNCNSGGSLDAMDVVAEALRQNLSNIVAGPIVDPEVVDTMIKAGVGAELEVAIGGKTNFDRIGGSIGPLHLRGKVQAISNGEIDVKGPVFTGSQLRLGRTVAFDAGSVLLVVSERRCEPIDVGIFTTLGIDPAACRFLIIKSKIQYRPTFGPLASHVLDCYGVGYATSDFSKFQFTKVNRPRYPLDEDAIAGGD